MACAVARGRTGVRCLVQHFSRRHFLVSLAGIHDYLQRHLGLLFGAHVWKGIVGSLTLAFVHFLCVQKFISRPFLPALSPNKTWEGFIGAFFWTLFFTPIQVYLFQMPDFWVCPYSQMDASYHCVRSAVFSPTLFEWPALLQPLLGHGITIAPV
jgi:hypothetical protein